METCALCAHWRAHPGKVRGECGVITPDGPSERAWTFTNDDPSGVGLETRRDFGCVEWQAKPLSVVPEEA